MSPLKVSIQAEELPGSKPYFRSVDISAIDGTTRHFFLREQRNKEKESHRRRHALSRAAGRRSSLSHATRPFFSLSRPEPVFLII